MRINPEQRLIRLSRWKRMGFYLGAAFLLGAPIGFLHRPLDLPGGLLAPLPPVLSLWGFWQFPILLLFSLILVKTCDVLFWRPSGKSVRKVVYSSLFLSVYLFFLIIAIAPLDQLTAFHLYSNTNNILGFLYLILNPVMVGLAIAFFFTDIDRPAGALSKAALTGGVAWTGTLTTFLILLHVYTLVEVRAPLSCFHWFCNNQDPTILLYNTWPIWISCGFLLALLGGLIGGALCYGLLGERQPGVVSQL